MCVCVSVWVCVGVGVGVCVGVCLIRSFENYFIITFTVCCVLH